MSVDNLIKGICKDQKSGFDCDLNNKKGLENTGRTKKYFKDRNKLQKEFNRLEQPGTFDNQIIEKIDGEIIAADDIQGFKELYQLTCDSILEDFAANNSELVKKHPYNWYKRILIDIKKNVPAITYKDLEKCIAVWDILAQLMRTIGLYPTYETFYIMTGVYKDQLKKQAESSPAYADFLQKIQIECDSALINELHYNPYNQTNKIFLAKVAGIVEKTEPKQIEVNHNIRNYDNINRYRLDQIDEKN